VSNPNPTDPLIEEVVAPLRAIHDAAGGTGLAATVEIFADETTRQLVDLCQAVTSRNTSIIAEVAHAMKGTTANFASRTLPPIFEEIERFAAAGDVDAIASRVDLIRSELNRLIEALRTAFPPQT
jgi:hypothetical protein